MKILSFLFLLIIVLSISAPFSMAACTGTSNYDCVSCNQGETGYCRQPKDLTITKVQAAYDDSVASDGTVYGDGIYLPAGTITWDQAEYFYITKKGLVLKGSGYDSTIINCATQSGAHWCLVAAADRIRITGLNFVGTGVASVLMEVYGSNIRVDHNKFSTTATTNSAMYTGNSTGVVDANLFDGDFFGSWVYNTGPDGSNYVNWNNPIDFGSANWLFIENNTIINKNSGGPDGFETQYGGKSVVRYNTLTESNNGLFGALQEQHNVSGPGGQGCGAGSRGQETYNNRVNMNTVSGNDRRLVHARAGTGLIYNNMLDYSIGGHNQSVFFIIRNYRAAGGEFHNELTYSDCANYSTNTGTCAAAGLSKCCSQSYNGDGYTGEGYPCTNGPGAGVLGGAREPFYIWGNTKTSDGINFVESNSAATGDPGESWAVQKDRDWFESTTKPAALATYSPYICPHPLVGVGHCNSAVAGTTGYIIGSSCTGSSPSLTATSPSYADVKACYDEATYGDTINIPAGTANWGDNSLTVTKAVWLKGAGAGSTVITCALYGLNFYPDSTSRTSDTMKFRVSGLELINSSGKFIRVTGTDSNIYISLSNNENSPSTRPITGANWTSYWQQVTGVPATHIWTDGVAYPTTQMSAINLQNYNDAAFEKIWIHDNKFTNWANGIYVTGNLYGVVSNNIFEDVGTIARGFGYWDNSWTNHPYTYGDANNLYYEDNIIRFTVDPATCDISHGPAYGYYGWVEAGQSGRFAFRYNTWDYTNCLSSAIMIDQWDMHGATSGGGGTMGAEFYGNKHYNDAPTDGSHTRRWMYHRGGQLLMFLNDWSWSTGSAPGIGVINETSDNTIYDQYPNNSYYFGNLSNGTNQTAGLSGDCCGKVSENNGFWNYNANCTSSSCSTGVGVGTDAPTGTCTTGVGYWKTNQSITDLTGMVGTNPTISISGTLYKCTATNTWTPYYTPYTYPHPLRSHGIFVKKVSGSNPSSPGSNIYTAASCENKSGSLHVKAAYDLASDGDTVIIPAGNCTWDTTLTLSKPITLQGAGVDSTIITHGAGTYTPLIQIAPSTGKENSFFRVTGIYFENTERGPSCGTNQYLNDINVSDSTKKYRIDHNTFHYGKENLPVGGNGVIDNNLFLDCDGCIRPTGDTDIRNLRPTTDAWGRTIATGTSDAVFIENNTFTFTDFSGCASCLNEHVYMHNGARAVIRYNTYTNACTETMDTIIDAHGKPGCDRGTVISEIYKNTYTLENLGLWAKLRGGSHIVHDNTITTSRYSPKFLLRNEFEVDGDSWPSIDQIFNSFFWNNRVNGTIVNDIVLVDPGPGNYISTETIHLNRDYFLHAPQATGGKEVFGGSAGWSNDYCTGAGTGELWTGYSASIPCCTGVGTGTCDMTLVDGENAYYPYVPYIYPHPLRDNRGLYIKGGVLGGLIQRSTTP